jgi:hypothetical protein
MEKAAAAIIISLPVVASRVPIYKKKLVGINAVNTNGITKLKIILMG